MQADKYKLCMHLVRKSGAQIRVEAFNIASPTLHPSNIRRCHAATNSTFNRFPRASAALASVVSVRLVSLSSRGGLGVRSCKATFNIFSDIIYACKSINAGASSS